MTDRDDLQRAQLTRRNWIVLAVLVAASALWQSQDLTLGVAAGGLLAIAAFGWMHRSLRRALTEPTRRSAWRFQFSYLVRLAAVATAIFLLIGVAKVHPVGLAVGLSVVVINIFWTTVRRLL